MDTIPTSSNSMNYNHRSKESHFWNWGFIQQAIEPSGKRIAGFALVLLESGDGILHYRHSHMQSLSGTLQIEQLLI